MDKSSDALMTIMTLRTVTSLSRVYLFFFKIWSRKIRIPFAKLICTSCLHSDWRDEMAVALSRQTNMSTFT